MQRKVFAFALTIGFAYSAEFSVAATTTAHVVFDNVGYYTEPQATVLQRSNPAASMTPATAYCCGIPGCWRSNLT